MKNLKDYLNESQHWMENPAVGDDFAIIIKEDCLLESHIIAVEEDRLCIEADSKLIGILESYGYTVEDTCSECMQEACSCSEEMSVDDVLVSEDPTEEEPATDSQPGAVDGTTEDDPIGEEQDPGEYDYEGDMAKDDLETIVRAARKLTGMLDDNENMPEWVQSKINKAADYVDTAADYIESNQDEVMDPEMNEAEYQGRNVPLGKPMRGDVKKFKVYVRDPGTGNIKKVNFGHGGTSAKRAGQKTMKIKKSNPARRKSFRARHNCDNPGPRTKARYWSCRAW